MNESSRAVFLSYASEDTGAAERIAVALRGARIEVWFDKSELRGGDVWDRQIRKQIHDCALFIPIISTHSQARLEGYFRREWKLAADRTHDMAEEKAFLVPVVIDDTSERYASVPDKFRDVQWTHLPAGETSAAFVERVKRLLLPEAAGDARGLSESAVPAAAAANASTRGRHGTARALIWAIALIVVVPVVLYYASQWSSWYRARVQSSTAPAVGSVGAEAIPDKSIAVLPFVDMSEKHDQEYFSDGLSEELIDLLTKIPDLRVPARTSSFFFKGKPEDIASISQKLRVAHVLEGSVRKAANTIRVTAQLIRADNGYHLWSETYDRDLKDVFKVQDEIAAAVVSALKVRLTPAEQGSNSRGTSNPEAHTQYLLGRQFLESLSSDGFRRSNESFRKAVALDPHYAAAYAALAYSEFFLSDSPDGKQRALRAAEKAVELAPGEADGYAARGFVRSRINWDWTGAQADCEKAMSIRSNDAWILEAYASVLAGMGRFPEAIAAARQATELDPLSTTSWGSLGVYLVFSRQYSAAKEAYGRELEIQPNSTDVVSLGELQLLEGKPSDALATFRSTSSPWGIAITEHTLGHAKESQQALDELIAKHGSALGIAEAYAWRGEKDKAFEWLERSYQHRDSGLFLIKGDPELSSLRGDPRYAALLTKMNLPE